MSFPQVIQMRCSPFPAHLHSAFDKVCVKSKAIRITDRPQASTTHQELKTKSVSLMEPFYRLVV